MRWIARLWRQHFDRRLWRDRSGTLLPAIAATVMVMSGSAAVVIDIARLRLVENRMQIAADAAVLAAAQDLPDTHNATTVVNQYLAANLPAEWRIDLNGAASFVTGSWDRQTRQFQANATPADAIQVELRRSTATANPVNTLLGGLFGIHSMETKAEAIAVRNRGGLELALVLDVSSSMAGRVDALRSAAMQLVTKIYDGAAVSLPDLWIALIPFSGRVNIVDHGTGWMQYSANVLTDSATGDPKLCTDRRSGSWRTDDTPPSLASFPAYTKAEIYCPGPPILPLTAGRSQVESAIQALYTGNGTSTHIGMVWGWRVLSPRWRGLWGEPDLPRDYDDPRSTKAVVIMTDGGNSPGTVGDSDTVAQTNDQLLQECAAMKAAGIAVYAVAFDTPASIDDLYQDCVSTPANFFRAEDSAALSTAFGKIGNKLQGQVYLVR